MLITGVPRLLLYPKDIRDAILEIRPRHRAILRKRCERTGRPTPRPTATRRSAQDGQAVGRAHLPPAAIGSSELRGISSQVRASSRRPARFLRTPPHCLKKNGTPSEVHLSRISSTHA